MQLARGQSTCEELRVGGVAGQKDKDREQTTLCQAQARGA